MALLKVLKEHPFTQGMGEPLLRKLAALAREVSFEEDEIVFRAGEKSTHFCLLLCGSACVEIRTPYYGLCVQTLGPGDAFGWSSLLDEHHTVFQVRAREPSSALFIDGHSLLEACQEDSKLGCEIFRRLARVVAKRVKATELKLAEFCGSAHRSLENETKRVLPT
jgi:CRP-like cAMP-binding protein